MQFKTKKKQKQNFAIEDDEETRLRVAEIIKSIKKDKIKEKDIRKLPIIEKPKAKRWTRKIQNKKEFIRNMKYKPISLSGKKRVIAGAISILAAGIVVVGIHNTNFSSKNEHKSPEIAVTQVNEPQTTDSIFIEEKIQPIVKVEKNEEIKSSISENDKEKDENIIEKKEEIDNQEKSKETKQDKKKEIKNFKKMAEKRYNESMVIGENLNIGDIFEEQTFSENPDGTGNKGYFSHQSNYSIGHISVITKDGWKVIDVKGKTLESILEENPEYETYNIHFVNGENGGALGFVTQSQYEELVENKINQIVENKTNNDINKSLEEELDR